MIQRGTGGFLNPDKILKQLNIRKDIKAADFGCGRGYFSIPLAKIIPDGTVYAVDVVEEALQAVEAKAKIENIANIRIVHANLEVAGDSGLNDNSINLIILANILYQSKNKIAIIQEAKRVVKKTGKIVLIEWLANSVLSPKNGWQMISKQESLKMAENEELNLYKELGQVDNQHYGLIFKK